MDLAESEQLRRVFKAFNHFMILLWRLGLGKWGNGTKWGGSIMVLKHRGRKSGKTYLTPVNYAIIDGDIYCTAGFGSRSDWYKNLMVSPAVEVWLPDGRWAGIGTDETETPECVSRFRQVLNCSGFAGPMFGADPEKLTDDDLARMLQDYRLIRIQKNDALTGTGGPGDLAWVWPLATFLLSGILIFKRKKRS